MKIRLSKIKDISNLSRIYGDIIRVNPYYSNLAKKSELERFSPKTLRKELADKENLYILAEDQNKILGAVNGYYEAGMFWIDWLVVYPELRRSGIGLNLMRFLENKLTKEGTHKIWCDSRTINKESKSLLRKIGFKKITTIKNHWYKQDFILWQKLLK